MIFKTGDLVVCLAHQGLGRIVSAKRAFGLCMVRWSEHVATEHPKTQLIRRIRSSLPKTALAAG